MGTVGACRGPGRLFCGEMVWQTRRTTGGQTAVGSHARVARFVAGYRLSDTAIDGRGLRLQALYRSSEEQVLFTICELSRKIRDREISPVELTHHCLVLIEKLNPLLNAYITVTAESALERARLAEREIFRGTYLGPLHGIPIGLKDIIDVAGVRTTAASAQFSTPPKDRVPSEDAEVVRRLRCRRSRLRRSRHRYRRFHPLARSLLRRRGAEADLWPREHARGHPAVAVARSRRPD